MRKANIAYCLVFILLCSLCPILMLAGGEEENLSKRSLAPLPSLVEEGRLNLTFPQGFDDYISDHIPYRNALITAYHRALALTGDIADDQVVQGMGDWLFFSDTMDDYMGVNQLTERQIQQLARSLRLQSDYIEGIGGRFIVGVAPNKNSIYSEMMPMRFGQPEPGHRNLARLQAELGRQGVQYVDWQAELLANKDEPVYYAVDTHWNERGAYIAYKSLLEAMDLGKQPIDLKLEWFEDYRGDLSAMAFPASEGRGLRAEAAGKFDYRYTRKPASMEAMSISTTAGGERALLMHRDSFANALIPLLSGHFATARYEREEPFRYQKADEMKPDVMVWEMAERNIPRLLDSAPVMPAPIAELDNITLIQGDSIRLYTESEHGLTHVYGYVDPALISDGQQLLLCVGEGEESVCYEPFPILEKTIAAQAVDEWGNDALHTGFSAWLNDAQPGDYNVLRKED